MQNFSDPVEDGFTLIAYAASRNIPLPPKERDLLVTAEAGSFRENPGKRTSFLGALEAVSNALGVSAAEVRATVCRVERLRPLISNALTLLDFAAANARPISDDIRYALTEAASAVAAGSMSVKHEQDFLKAYEKLTSALTPITAETLEASTTRLPSFGEVLRGFRAGQLPKWTLGRFINASIFLVVLMGTGVSLAYYYGGASALVQFRELQKAETVLKEKEAIFRLDLVVKRLALSAAKRRSEQGNASTADREDVSTAENSLEGTSAKLEATVAERAAVEADLRSVSERLGLWAMQPCRSANRIFNLTLCVDIGKLQSTTASKELSAIGTTTKESLRRSVSDAIGVEAARTIISRLNDVYLPLLLGFLGAHAFILRRMSKDISERAFAKGSAFNHIVRIGLGSLAGLASTWLLTPEIVGGSSFKALPVWVLAFVAGYGIELVFAFMDRIIGAFTSPSK